LALATICIGFLYGITTLPYPRPFLPAISTLLSQTNCQYLMYKLYIFFHGNKWSQNCLQLQLNYFHQFLTLNGIWILNGMNPSLFPHVLSPNILFLLSRNIFIILSPLIELFCNLSLCSYFNLQLSCCTI
jgi:hypothetical protein